MKNWKRDPSPRIWPDRRGHRVRPRLSRAFDGNPYLATGVLRAGWGDRFLISRKLRVRRDLKLDFSTATWEERRTVSHAYHRYPAKFIPPMVRTLLYERTRPGDVVLDCFSGSGTTLLEAMLTSRKSIGFDLNPLANFITSVKVTPIDPLAIDLALDILRSRQLKVSSGVIQAWSDPRIKYWFTNRRTTQLEIILSSIARFPPSALRSFFLCAFSHILKDCSRWLQSSVKPTRDPGKRTGAPWERFEAHCRTMSAGNESLFRQIALLRKADKRVYRPQVLTADARAIPLRSETIDFILTSPPYFISYDYVDILRLSLLWFELAFGHKAPPKRLFMGSRHARPSDETWPSSEFALEMREAVKCEKPSRRLSVLQYLRDVESWLSDLPRLLKPRGTACFVVGNPILRNQRLPLVEYYCEALEKAGLSVDEVRKREISNKSIPQTRDTIGRFASSGSKAVTVYPTEYVVSSRKAA